MLTKGNCNRAKFHKLTAMMDSPSRAEAIAAFGLALDELAKDQDARFSVEYSLGNPDAEEAAQEMARLRAELAEAFESVARYETTTKQLEETIDRLHESMAEVDDHFQPLEPPKPVRPPNAPKPSPVQPRPVMPFDWGAGTDDLAIDTPQQRTIHSGPFLWSVLGWWAYGFAVGFWLVMVCLPGLRNSYRSFFLPLLWIVAGIPGFLYFRKLRESYGWIGIAVKVCLTAELLTIFTALCFYGDWEMPVLTRREEVFAFVALFGFLWFLYSERFFTWVLDERKRTQFVVIPGAAFILIAVVAWVTATDTRAVKASAPSQRFSQSPHVRKHHPAPKPTPPPDDPARILNYDYELPARVPSAPVFVQASYSPATDSPSLVAASFQTSTSSDPISDGVELYFLVLVAIGIFSVLATHERKRQRQKRYRKALDEANAPLPQNETGNAGHASMKDLKKRGWA